MNPLVSILIATRNGKNRITKAVESILAQDYDNIEILIRDDTSDDDSFSYIQNLAEKHAGKIHVFQNTENLGVAGTSALLLRDAKGVYAGRLDDDDYFTDKDKILKQVKFLETHTDYTLVGTWCNLTFPDGKIRLRKSPTENENIRTNVYKGGNPFVNATVLFRKDVARECGGYNPQLRTTEDLDLFLKLGAKGKMKILPEVTTAYTVSEHSLSGKKRFQEAKDMIRVLMEHRKENSEYTNIFSMLYIICRQLAAALIPRNIVMKIKYKRSHPERSEGSL